MHISSVLLVAVGAIVASANRAPTTRAITSILKRDIPGLPSGCNSRCSAANRIYDACLSNDMDTCLSICDADVAPQYQDCLNCILDEAPESVRDQFQASVDQLESLCDSTTPPSTSDGLDPTGGGFSPSGIGASATSSPATSRTSQPPQSSNGGGAENDDTTGGGGVQPSNVETSGAAGVAIKFPNMIGGVVALVGAGAGAALLF